MKEKLLKLYSVWGVIRTAVDNRQTEITDNSILIYNKIARFFIVHFKPSAVQKGIDAREGQCNQCGVCCNIFFHCPFLKKDETHTVCSIYKMRPLQCKAFPFREQDIKDINYQCTFKFPNEIR